MNYDKKDINERALYILREDNGKFYTEYFPFHVNEDLSNSIKKLKENMQEMTKDKNLSKQEIYNIKTQMILDYWDDIQKNHSYLIGYRDYCYNITGSYVSRPGISKDFKMSFLPFSEELNDVRIKKTDKDSTYIESIFSNAFFKSYFIEEAYNECKNNNNIKVYSHRRIGETINAFEANNILSVKIKTNFGHGWRNCFEVYLIYDGILIIPYSRLVVYYKCVGSLLIDDTWCFYMTERSWKDAFDMVRDACNDCQQGTGYFIEKYFTDELDKLTSKLREYLNVSEFEFSEEESGYCIDIIERGKMKIQLDSFPLIILRGQKITGAVNFVENIKKANKILSTKKYVDVIVDCCEKILLQFDEALNELEPKIEELENIYKQEYIEQERLETRFKESKLRMEAYNKLEKAIEDKIYESTTNLILQEMAKVKEEYNYREKQFEDQTTKCSEIYYDLDTHKSYFSQISEYKENIDLFLEK